MVVEDRVSADSSGFFPSAMDRSLEDHRAMYPAGLILYQIAEQ